MVETACENNDEGIDSDSNTIDIIVEKEDMIVAVLFFRDLFHFC
jgi:hypothetical protein